MKVPTALDSGLGQVLPDSTPIKQQTLTVPAGAFGGARANTLISLAQGIGGIGDIVATEERKARAEEARRARAEEARARREREDEIAGEQAEEEFESRIAETFNAVPPAGDKTAANRFREIDEALPGHALEALGALAASERGKLAPYFAARVNAARGQLATQRQAYTEAGVQAARASKLKRGRDDAVAARGDPRVVGASLALIDDVVAREARDKGLTAAAENTLQRLEEGKVYGAVYNDLLQTGEAVAAELFLNDVPKHIWDDKVRQEKEDILLPALERENAADAVQAIRQGASGPGGALKRAKLIKNPQVRALTVETLEARSDLQDRTKFDARVREFHDVYTTLGAAGGDTAAVSETQWQQLDGRDGKGKERGEAKAARRLAKRLREGAPIETDWRLYYSLLDLPPQELATLPIWDHADKLNRAEFLLFAERQQQTRAALASGAPVTAAGAPGSLDAQLAALAKTKGWDSEPHAETRGLHEREIRAEIAEAVEVKGGKPLTIAENRKLIKEAAADMPATVVAAPSGVDDTLVGSAGDDTLPDGVEINTSTATSPGTSSGPFGGLQPANPNSHLTRFTGSTAAPLDEDALNGDPDIDNGKQKFAVGNDPIPDLDIDAGNEQQEQVDDAGVLRKVGDGLEKGYFVESRRTNIILLDRNLEILRMFDEINAGKSVDEVVSENPQLKWDSLFQPYWAHPEKRQTMHAEMQEIALRQLSRFVELSEKISNIPDRPDSTIQEIAEGVVPGIKNTLLTILGSVYGAYIAGHNRGFGDGMVNLLEEAGADLSDADSIFDTLNDLEKREKIVEKARNKGILEAFLNVLTAIFPSGGLSNVVKARRD